MAPFLPIDQIHIKSLKGHNKNNTKGKNMLYEHKKESF